MKRRHLLLSAAATLATGLNAVQAAATSPSPKPKGQMMIIVTVDVEFEDDQIHQTTDAIKAMDAASNMEEGCVAYRSSFDVTNPRILRIYEMWGSMKALGAHFQTPHMAEFQSALGGLKSKGMNAKVY